MEEKTYIEGFHHKDLVQKMFYTEFGNTGMRLSKLGFGGGPVGGVYGSFSEEEAINTIVEAIKSGINYIDTAPWYGNGRSEEVLGKALKQVPRSAYYIGTKVGRYSTEYELMFNFSKEHVLSGFQKSLDLLGLDYVDVIQVHDLEFCEDINQVLNETLPALQSLVDAKKARFIGVTGYPISSLKEVVEKSSIHIDSVLSYARNTIIDQELKEYIPYFKNKGMGVISACAVCMGLLTNGEVRSWHPATKEMRDAVAKARKYCQERDIDIARLSTFYSLKTEGVQVFLAGISTMDILQKNFDLYTSAPSEEEEKIMQEVKTKFFDPIEVKNWEGENHPEKHWSILKMLRGELPKTEEIKPFQM